MASERSELQWQNVDLDELPSNLVTHYNASKEAYRAYKTARDTFEHAMRVFYADSVSDDSELKFGYNFGKLSVAIGPKTARKVKAETKQTLAEFLAAQAESGR